jgi:hypothetical protein
MMADDPIRGSVIFLVNISELVTFPRDKCMQNFLGKTYLKLTFRRFRTKCDLVKMERVCEGGRWIKLA